MKISFFVSSTFKDMDSERDLLRTVVSSRLNHMYEKKGLTFEFVDLRYSVTTDSSLTLEEREQQIFDFCMGEIDRCAPYFIGLLGQRYGWVPDHKTDSQKREIDKRWNDDINLRKDQSSVTFLEFLQGAIGNREDSRPGKFFYLRSENSYDEMNEDELEDFIDSQDGIERNKVVREYLKTLDGKNGIKVSEYTMTPSSPSSVDMEKWCEMVIGDISEMIDKKFANQVDLDPFIATNERYIEDHIRNFKGREELLEQLQWPEHELFITGTPGSGRTSLLCKVYDLHRKEEDSVPLFASIYATPSDFDVYTLISKWTKQIFNKTQVPIPPKLVDPTDLSVADACKAYKEYLSKVNLEGYFIVHFIEGSILEFNDLFNDNCYLVMLQEDNPDHLKYLSVDTSDLDEYTQEEIASQLRPALKVKLLQHQSANNIGWLSLAIHILENQMRGRQKEMRKGYRGLFGEEAITAFLCDLIDSFPLDIEDLRGFWINQLADIFGFDFMRDYMSCHKLAPNGISEEIIAQISGVSLSWCVSFRQSAGSSIFEFNGFNLLTVKSRKTVLNVLNRQPDSYIQRMARLMKETLESLEIGYVERSNLFTSLLYLKDYNSLVDYFSQDSSIPFLYEPCVKVELIKIYSWNRFVNERFFDAQDIVAHIVEKLPIDISVWLNFISWHRSVDQGPRFLFMSIIEKKIKFIMHADPKCQLAKVMQEVYRTSVNCSPDISTKKIELRKYLSFFSELFNKDIIWREQYIAAVSFYSSFMPDSERYDFLLSHLEKLEVKKSKYYVGDEPPREFAVLLFYIMNCCIKRSEYFKSLDFAIPSCLLFKDSLNRMLDEGYAFERISKALNCYHSEILSLIFLYDQLRHCPQSIVILERLSEFVTVVDAIVEKFNGFGNPTDDGLLDECRVVYFYSRSTLICADDSLMPVEKLNSLMELQRLCLNFIHYDCKPREEDVTMPEAGTMALMLLAPNASMWFTLVHIIICCQAANLIFKYKLGPEETSLFGSFLVPIDYATIFIRYKMNFPCEQPFMKSVFDTLKVWTCALIQAYLNQHGEEELDDMYEKADSILDGLDELPPESEIFSIYLGLVNNFNAEQDTYEDLIANEEYAKVIQLNNDEDYPGFIDYYYMGLAYLRADMPAKAKEIYEMLMRYSWILDSSQEFSCVCNLLAACLKDLDLESYLYYYNNFCSDPDREDSDIAYLQNLYEAYKNQEINSSQLRECIAGNIL